MAKVTYVKPQNVVTTEKDDKNAKGYFWEFILYPDEDLEHKQIFDIFSNNQFNNVRWITHHSDKWDEKRDDNGNLIHYSGEPRKSHVHMLWKSECKIDIDKCSAVSRVPTHLIQRVNSVAVYSQYLLHKDVDSLFNPNKHKYSDSELLGALPLVPVKWDDDYLFDFYCTFIINTSLSWGCLCMTIGRNGHLRFLNKYRNLLKDIYYSYHIDGENVYKNPYLKKEEFERCTTQFDLIPLEVKTKENGSTL